MPLKPELLEYGSTGLQQSYGVLDEEWLRQLRGPLKWKIYKEMRDNDPVVGAILFAIKMLIRGVKWRVKPSIDGDTESQKTADFVWYCLNHMEDSWVETLDEVLSMLPFGFAPLEEVYQKFTEGGFSGKYGWKRLALRAQETIQRWIFDDKTGELVGLEQFAPPKWKIVPIPVEKLLLFRPSTHKSSPEGISILRTAFVPWYRKKRIEEVEGIGLERDLAGFPVMYVPSRILKEEGRDANDTKLFNVLRKQLISIRRGEQEGIMLPADMHPTKGELVPLVELKLLSTGGQRQFDTTTIVERYDRRIAMTCLADMLFIGHQAVGSFALSSDKTALFASAIGAWLGGIASVMMNKAFPRLLQYNGIDKKYNPLLEYSDLETPSLAELGTYVKDLAGSGVQLFPDDELEDHLRTQAGFPLKPEEDELAEQLETERRLRPSPVPPSPGPGSAGQEED